MQQQELFQDTFYPNFQQRTQPVEEYEYGPWISQGEKQKKRIEKEQFKVRINNRRFSNRLDGYHPKTERKTEKSAEKTQLVAFKSVTIQYEIGRPSQSHSFRQQCDLKLPVLGSGRSTNPQSSLSPNSKSQLQSWSFLKLNKRSSLRRYNLRRRDDSTEHFEIYKRSLIAARQSVIQCTKPLPSVPRYISTQKP